MYATLYLNNHPDKVAAAVLMEPGPLNGQLFDSISSELYDLDFFSEWFNDDAWDSQFLTPDDQARADYHRMLGARDSQPKYHHSTQIRRRSGAWERWRTAASPIPALRTAKVPMTSPITSSAYTRRVLFIASA